MKLARSLALATLSCASCATPAEPEETAPPEALIGGIPAVASALDAIGALVIVESVPDCEHNQLTVSTTPVCTATLIGPHTVVTAKHCMNPILSKYTPESRPYFLIGADRSKPKRQVEVVAWETAPTFEGGWAGNGRDVAVLQLGEPVRDVTPAQIATPTASLVGRRLAAVGYGAANNDARGGARTTGSVTCNALGGSVYAAMFGGFDAFRAWYMAAPPSDEPEPTDAQLRARYESTQLLPGYEAHAGARAGDAQPCFGDSGGPLLESRDGLLTVYGVASGGVPSTELICDGGSVYATFGTETLAMLERARGWTDPCEGISALGRCDGDVARHCTSVGEGARRLVVTDCASLAQSCAMDATRGVVCSARGDATEPLIPETLPQCGGRR